MSEQLQRVKGVAKYQCIPVFEVALAEATNLCFSDPFLGEQTAYLAFEVARQIPNRHFSAQGKRDLQGKAATIMANCRRLRADWTGAAQAICDAQSFLAEGTGDPILEGMLLEIHSLLCSDTGNVETALIHSSRALGIYGELGDKVALARTAVLKANTLLAVARSEEAIASANFALENVGPQEARLEMLANGIIVESLILLGRPRQALCLFSSAKALFDQVQDRGSRLRVRYLEARLLESLDSVGEAETIYEDLVDAYMDSEFYKEAFITFLTLFELHARRGVFEKAAAVCEKAMGIWSQGGFSREIREAWVQLLGSVQVRQFSENVLLRTRRVILGPSGVPPAEGIPQALHHALRPPPEEKESARVPTAPPIPPDLNQDRYRNTREAFDRELVATALEDAGGNISEASRRLGMTRNTLKAKLRRYGL
jgi:tetratricopeptide (TPR) repeat protein